MRVGLVAMLIVLLGVSSAAAQPTADQMHAQKSGSLKIWTGAALIVGGAVLLPLTVKQGNKRDGATAIGLGTVGVGTWFVWSGFQQQRRALGPRTDVGLALGQRKSVVVRRRW